MTFQCISRAATTFNLSSWSTSHAVLPSLTGIKTGHGGRIRLASFLNPSNSMVATSVFAPSSLSDYVSTRNKLLLAGYATMLHYSYAISKIYSTRSGHVGEKIAAFNAGNVFVTTVYREGFVHNEIVFFYFDLCGLSSFGFEELRARICCHAFSPSPRTLATIWTEIAKVRQTGSHWQCTGHWLFVTGTVSA